MESGISIFADKELDEVSYGIDWDELIADAQGEMNGDPCAYDSADYPTEGAAMAALARVIREAVHGGQGEKAAASSSHASRR